jgi:hypothetical protein
MAAVAAAAPAAAVVGGGGGGVRWPTAAPLENPDLIRPIDYDSTYSTLGVPLHTSVHINHISISTDHHPRPLQALAPAPSAPPALPAAPYRCPRRPRWLLALRLPR